MKYTRGGFTVPELILAVAVVIFIASLIFFGLSALDHAAQAEQTSFSLRIPV